MKRKLQNKEKIIIVLKSNDEFDGRNFIDFGVEK